MHDDGATACAALRNSVPSEPHNSFIRIRTYIISFLIDFSSVGRMTVAYANR